MAITRLLMHLFLFVALLQLQVMVVMVSSDIETAGPTVVKGSSNRRLLPYLDCGEACKVRCSLHSRPNLCSRACGTCCVRCKCVPPGTSGNRQLCGTCYTDMTTHANRTKCP